MKSQFIDLLLASSKASLLANDLQGRILGSQNGVIVDVEDPAGLGRVKVLLDSRDGLEAQFSSNWISSVGSFLGKQPISLLGNRVNISFVDGDPKKGILGDVVTDEKSAGEPPTGSTMVRLPIYTVGELPPASEMNRGCTALLIDDQYGDYIVVCLKRNGTFLWERQSPLTHIHSGQEDGTQAPDSAGHSEQPVKQDTKKIFDAVTPTTESPRFGGVSGAS